MSDQTTVAAGHRPHTERRPGSSTCRCDVSSRDESGVSPWPGTSGPQAWERTADGSARLWSGHTDRTRPVAASGCAVCAAWPLDKTGGDSHGQRRNRQSGTGRGGSVAGVGTSATEPARGACRSRVPPPQFAAARSAEHRRGFSQGSQTAATLLVLRPEGRDAFHSPLGADERPELTGPAGRVQYHGDTWVIYLLSKKYTSVQYRVNYVRPRFFDGACFLRGAVFRGLRPAFFVAF